MLVSVYYNTHKKCWSIKYKGKIIDHKKELLLANCSFHVSEAGRQRVIKSGRKNVHAWITGELLDAEFKILAKISYNPYKFSQFMCNDKPIVTCSGVYFNNGCFKVIYGNI